MESLKDRTQELQDIMDEFAGAKKNASIFVKEAAEKGDIVIGSFCQYAPMEIINAGGSPLRRPSCRQIFARL